MLGFLQRASDLGPQFAHRFQPLTGAEFWLDGFGEFLRAITGHLQSIGGATAGAQQFASGDVRRRHQDFGGSREEIAGDLRLLNEDLRDARIELAHLNGVAHFQPQARGEPFVDKHFARINVGLERHPFTAGTAHFDFAAQRVQRGHRLDVRQHRVFRRAAILCGCADHAAKTCRFGDSQSHRGRALCERLRQRPIARDHGVRSEHHVGLIGERGLHTVGKHRYRSNTGDRHREREHQNACFGRAQLTPNETQDQFHNATLPRASRTMR